MNCGETNITLGTLVKINNIKDKDDLHLNGLTGKTTHPFAFGSTGKNWIGIFLDNGGRVNVKISEITYL